MAKRARTKTPSTTTASTDGPSPRQPCPCGSGRRYKACHGSPSGAPPAFVARPFEGVPAECDLVALREFVPSATLSLTTTEGDVLAGSMLPGAAAALHRQDGEIWLGLQVQQSYGDASRAAAAAIESARDAGPGQAIGLAGDPGEGPRLQDLVTAAGPVTVHEGFDWWVGVDLDESTRSALDEANAMVAPTVRLGSVEAAYWTSVGGLSPREFVRWVMPYGEGSLLDAFARLHAAGTDRLGAASRLIGMFRAQGLLVPVWELEAGTGPEGLEESAPRLADVLGEALALDGDLTSAERSARAGLVNRQVTLR